MKLGDRVRGKREDFMGGSVITVTMSTLECVSEDR